ncbi:MAG: FAD-binding protein [Kiritimatiellaeota bacterium]|nr:FAD-binding protein [Kiritimatiellota bacterium]
MLVCADSGVSLQSLIKASLARNCLGLEDLAGIPGTVGGALYNNAHFSGRRIGDRIVAVEYIDSRGRTLVATPRQLHFGYDSTDFRRHPDWVATRIFFALTPGDGTRGRRKYRELLTARRNHAGRSAGCVFANLSVYQQRKARLPSPSIGYINDRLLGIRGLEKGGAVLGTHHGNFITNEGNASSSDVLQLIRTVRQEYRDRFGLRLRLEIRVV